MGKRQGGTRENICTQWNETHCPQGWTKQSIRAFKKVSGMCLRGNNLEHREITQEWGTINCSTWSQYESNSLLFHEKNPWFYDSKQALCKWNCFLNLDDSIKAVLFATPIPQ